jgi:hypothetical protein
MCPHAAHRVALWQSGRIWLQRRLDSGGECCAGYAIYSTLKERTWFKEVTKKASKKAGPTVEKTERASVDKSDYLVGTPHDIMQRKREAKKAK